MVQNVLISLDQNVSILSKGTKCSNNPILYTADRLFISRLAMAAKFGWQQKSDGICYIIYFQLLHHTTKYSLFQIKYWG